MNLDSSSYALIHISNIVANLTKKNFKVSSQEIQQVRGPFKFQFANTTSCEEAPATYCSTTNTI